MAIRTRLFISAFLAGAMILVSWMKPVKVKLPPIAKELEKQFAYIPSGSFEMDSTTVSVRNFYMSKTEVSNGEYQLFLAELKAAGRTEDCKTATIDSIGWKAIYGDAYVEYYHRHLAYKDYPVVNITYEAAVLYCKWLTEKWNKASKNGLVYEFRLPERPEFIHAGMDKTYAWGDPYLREPNGTFRANFVTFGDESIHRDPKTGKPVVIAETDKSRIAGSLDEQIMVTAPVTLFTKNVYGIYNMNGNVAEMIVQKGTAVGGDWSCTGYDIRNQSTQSYDKPSPKVGFRPVMVVTTKEAGK